MPAIIAVYLDIQPSHKKHDGMMVVFAIEIHLFAEICTSFM